MANKAQSQNKTPGISEEQQRQIEEDVSKEIERKQEASKAAEKAQYCKKKAKELADAAKAAGDPDERQKLLNEALEKEVEAETFGKTAKYLQSGAFQGMLAGTGLGGGIGVSLGIITGTLVGGTTATVTGGIGAGVGLGVGAVHGPFVKVGHLMGDGIRKITGDIPGWKATKEQKAALEKMVHGVQEQEVPDDDELELIRADGVTVQKKAPKQNDTESSSVPFKESMPSMPSMPGRGANKSSQDETQANTTTAKSKAAAASKNMKCQAEDQIQEQVAPQDQRSAIQSKVQPGQAITSANAQKSSHSSTSSPAASQAKQENGKATTPSPASHPRPSRQGPSRQNVKAPERTLSTGNQPVERAKKKPRKLEVRSANATGSPTSKRTTQKSGG